MKIGITGASGLIGRALGRHFEGNGHEVYRFVRRAVQNDHEILWDPNAAHLDPALLSQLDAVVHLAGEPVFGRWTEAKKNRILESRQRGTALIAKAVGSLNHKCTLVSCSAIGYYGSSLTEVFTEGDPSGTGFLAEVCRLWEAATLPAQSATQRVVLPRIGLVLSPEAGALKQMLLPFKAGLGGVVASGSQWMSWISLRDTVRVLALCVTDERLSGAVNCVGPNPVTNRTFTKALANALKRPALIPVPSFGLKLLYGTMADETVLASQNVRPKALQALEHKFLDVEIKGTLERLLG